MDFDNIIVLIGIIATIIGIIVGIIGIKCLTIANKIKNTAENINDSTIQQAQIINNGMDSYAVIRLSRETTQDELNEIIKQFNNEIINIKQQIENQPKIYSGTEEPKALKSGDIYFRYSK